jgi:ABC-type antimicrobial peptide transport system permease subunit
MLVETSRTASLGLAVGLMAAAGLVRLVSNSASILPEFGPRPFLLGAAIVAMATTVATLAPLRRAARIDPAQALRTS